MTDLELLEHILMTGQIGNHPDTPCTDATRWFPADPDADGERAVALYKQKEGAIIMEGNKKKAMLSQPMAGFTNEQITATRDRAIAALEAAGYEVVNTLFTDEWYSREKMVERGVVQIPLCFLAKSLENMSLCHAAYFCKGWENARGCKIEHDAAVAYGLEIIYEE